MNVQETILKGIRELLHRENFLVLPGFGGFVLKPQGAGYNSSSTLLYPASKTPGFNRQLKQNDGVLQNWLQHELNGDAAEARHHLEEFAEYCNSVLNTRRRLNMKGLGFFYLDFENNLNFEAESGVNFQAESFGLAPIHLQVLKPEAEQSEIRRPKVFKDRVQPEEKALPALTVTRPRLKRSLLIASSVVLLFSLLAALVSLNGVSGRLYAAVFSGNSQSLYRPLPYEPIFQPEADAKIKGIRIEQKGAMMLLELEPGLQLMVKPLSAEELDKASAEKIVENYYTVVLGSFSVPQNAVNFVRQIKAKHPERDVFTSDQKQRRMVSLGRFTNKEDARQAMMLLSAEYPGAWVLKR